jgi:hypothetical protein
LYIPSHNFVISEKLPIEKDQPHGRYALQPTGVKAAWSEPMFMEVFTVAAWSIWKERNNLHFNGVTPQVLSWKARFKADFALVVHRTKGSLHNFISGLLDSVQLS